MDENLLVAGMRPCGFTSGVAGWKKALSAISSFLSSPLQKCSTIIVLSNNAQTELKVTDPGHTVCVALRVLKIT